MPLRLLCLLALLGLALPVHAQERASDEARVSPNALIGQTIGTTSVIVTYGRPSVRDRDVFGGLEPYDAVWRTGANEATTVTFSDDVLVEGEPLEAGTYSLFTIPRAEGEWIVIFNNVAEQWGAYDYDADQDALRVMAEPQEGPFMEMMTFAFNDVDDTSADLVLLWDETMLPVSIQTAGS